METVEDVVIVGAGIAGLATALGLHRLGIRSLVLESSESLRTTGFAFTMWTNAWKAIDAVGIGSTLRGKSNQLTGLVTTSANSGLITSELPFVRAVNSRGDHHVRGMDRKVLLEVLENELPRGTIRYSSKVVHIQNASCFKSVHLSDGTIIKAKVLVGCDGVNSVVAKFLGLSKPCCAGRSAIRGFVKYKDGHDFEPKFLQFFGRGVRYGVIPCDDHSIYWFFTFSPSSRGADEDSIEEDPSKMKEFVLSKLGNVSDKIRKVFEDTDLNSMICSPLRFRNPWDLLWGNISKDNVCVAGDAFHPMTPDLAQGGCSSLEDSVILSRILGKAVLNYEKQENNEEKEYRRIVKGLEKFARERRWRGFDLIKTGYLVGLIQQSDGIVKNFLRDRVFAKYLAGILLKKASFDCGNLSPMY